MLLYESISIISLFIYVTFYASYYLICFIYRNKKNKIISIKSQNSKELPIISFIIPVYNENKVIEDKFKNLDELIYSKDKLEIIFVDGGSTDGTIKNIKNNMEYCNLNIKLVEQGSRLGFNKAVIDGFKKSTGEIIFIPGAETIYNPDVLNIMVPYFTDSNIGAVNGRQIITNLDEGISPRHEQAYRNIQDILRSGENNIDTLFDVKGEIVATRRSICEKLVNNPEFVNKGCIDACFIFQSRKEGYISIYEPRAVYYENSPSSMEDSYKQRLRRAATLIQNMYIFKEMLFNKTYGLFGMFIFPAHYLMLVIFPYLFLFNIISLLILNILYFPSILYLSTMFLGIMLLTLSTTIQSFIKLQIILLIANIKLFTKMETQKFERIESTRQSIKKV